MSGILGKRGRKAPRKSHAAGKPLPRRPAPQRRPLAVNRMSLPVTTLPSVGRFTYSATPHAPARVMRASRATGVVRTGLKCPNGTRFNKKTQLCHTYKPRTGPKRKATPAQLAALAKGRATRARNLAAAGGPKPRYVATGKPRGRARQPCAAGKVRSATGKCVTYGPARPRGRLAGATTKKYERKTKSAAELKATRLAALEKARQTRAKRVAYSKRSSTACKAGTVRNPVTKKCVRKCPPGTLRDLSTQRCRRMTPF